MSIKRTLSGKEVFFGLAAMALFIWFMATGGLNRNTPPATKEVDQIKRGVIAMDAIYASEGAFKQHGMTGINTIVRELQAALAMWPNETGNGEGIDACRMALKVQTTYMLNVMDRLGLPADSRSSNFRQECRTAINYSLDDTRIHQTWSALTGN